MLKHLAFIPLLFTLFSSATTAQSSPTAETLTLEKAINIALKNNFQIQQAENNLERAQTQEQSSFWDFFPDLNANLNYSQTRGTQFNQFTQTFSDQFLENASGSIRTSVNIFDGFRNINNLRSSKESVIAQKEQLTRAKEDLIFNVASQFLAILLDQQLIEIAEQNLASQKKQLEQVIAQVEVGSRPVADQYNQESLVAQNEFNVIQRQNTLANDQLRLVRSLQLDPLKEYEFERPELSEVIDFKEYSVNELVSSALKNRSDLRAQEASIKSANYAYKSAFSGHYPSLNFSAGYASNYAYIEVGGIEIPRSSFYDQFFNENVNNFLQVSIQIPIFNRFNIHNQIQSAKVQYKNAQLQLENLKLGVVQEVKQAYTDYVSFAKQFDASEKALVFATKSLETQQERYNIGSSTLIELAQANAQFVEASSNRAQALFRLIFQEQLINYFVGKINPDFTLN